MLSWKISQYLDTTHDHLFYNVLKTKYIIIGYMCACGHEEILLSPYKGLRYSCPKCNNYLFYDANMAHKSFDRFIEEHHDNPDFEDYFYYHETKKSAPHYLEKCNFPIEYEYAVVNDDDKIISSYRTLDIVPNSIDFARKKIIKQPIELYTFTLNKDGRTTENYCMQYDYQMFATLRSNLNQYINANKNSFNVPAPNKKFRINYKNVAFFSNYPWLKEFNFCLWEDVKQLPNKDTTVQSALEYLLKGRNEKSIKKALYQNYHMQLEKYDCFKSTLINAIVETIKDPNFIADLFKQELHYEGITVAEENYLKQLIHFLQKHYSEKQIVSFIKNIRGTYYFLDLLRSFIYIEKELHELFRKPKCTLMALHDEFVQCSTKKRNSQIANENITYLYGQEKAKTSIMSYDVKLPSTGAELLHWAETLNNCLSSYFEPIHDNTTTIYGFFKGDTIEFAVEITDKTIIQASGFCNKNLTDTQNEALKTWFNRFIVNAKDTNFLDNTAPLEGNVTRERVRPI